MYLPCTGTNCNSICQWSYSQSTWWGCHHEPQSPIHRTSASYRIDQTSVKIESENVRQSTVYKQKNRFIREEFNRFYSSHIIDVIDKLFEPFILSVTIEKTSWAYVYNLHVLILCRTNIRNKSITVKKISLQIRKLNTLLDKSPIYFIIIYFQNH